MGLRPFAECGAKVAAQLFRSTHWCSMLCDMQDHPASVLEPGPAAALHVAPPERCSRQRTLQTWWVAEGEGRNGDETAHRLPAAAATTAADGTTASVPCARPAVLQQQGGPLSTTAAACGCDG